MRIGELAARTGVSTRLLRYYEEQGLLDATRTGNGYRDYDEDAVERVERVRRLIDAGVPTAVIHDMLPCLLNGLAATPRIDADVARTLEAHRDQLESRIACLSRSRDAVADYLRRAEPLG
ncbi:MerR family transcriptional regulator [Agromyces archimandritae]|uniref:MerR family transcriptional regulator n=2 Tax=Agromyces archimandritae TaxID=2781962 RepID=A0A975IQ28_9MICO|nr:MerR family transcriptional regulator [Agromyces archimandritae]